jgi:hypothetical protein
MSDDRKYTQRGYQDGERRPSRDPKPRGADGRPAPAFTAFKETVRCDGCGADLPPQFEVTAESRCPRCGDDLHTCRNCLALDPAARNECARPVTERVGNKRAANRCEHFEIRRVSVKETTFSGSSRPSDPRRAFEDLFRKK